MSSKTKKMILIVLTTFIWLLSGCAGIGPATVARDRFDYTVAISDSWKNQMLLNMVKVRYGDAPIFLDVASVINQYSVEKEFGLGASVEIHNVADSTFFSPTVHGVGRYVDRPTITYSPITGEKFAKSLMTPISPLAIFHLVQSGYPIDIVFRFSVQSINGIQNRFGGMARAHSADHEFYPLLEQLRKIQKSNSISMRIKKVNNKETVMIAFDEKIKTALPKESQDIRKLLGLDLAGTEFEVVYDAVSRNEKEIAIITRSMLESLIDLASLIEVPESHVAEKRVNPTFKDELTENTSVQPLIKVYNSVQKPDDAFVSVYYRDHWFFIDDKDLPSKGVFSFLMFAFTLTETGTNKESVPIVTVPTN